jgi:Kef-type K+ transport system membrane component KefB
MFQETVVWKGIIYSILMTIAKGLVSLVIYFEYFSKWLRTRKKRIITQPTRSVPLRTIPKTRPETFQAENTETAQIPQSAPHAIALLVGFAMIARGEIGFLIASLSQSSGTLTLKKRDGSDVQTSGEEIFLVIVWAVVLCTIVGPVGVGITIRRLRQQDSAEYRGWL